MRKFLVAFISMAILFVSVPVGLATDICEADPLTIKDFNVEITSAVFLRDISCMEGSTVITTLSAGEVVHVIGQTEGWHKIERSDGTQGWIWETFVTPTDRPFEGDPVDTTPTETQNDPLYDIVGHKYEDSIRLIFDKGIVGGYPDGSYQADRIINRAELLKIIVEAAYLDEFESFGGSGCFTDVDPGLWYTKYVCFAQSRNIVGGYADGSFRPDQNINFVEALKIAMIGFEYGYVAGDPWYWNIVSDASDNAFIPLDINAFDEELTRGQMADMIARMTTFGTVEFDQYSPGDSSYFVTYNTIEAGLDVSEVVGTGSCIFTDTAVESGFVYEYCTCGGGQWYCEEPSM